LIGKQANAHCQTLSGSREHEEEQTQRAVKVQKQEWIIILQLL
jgi:hypothetical protein